MTALRQLLRTRPRLLAWLVLCALAVKLLVPAGYMPDVADGRMAIVDCPGMTAGHPHGAPADRGATGQPCVFAALAAPVAAIAGAPIAAVMLVAVALLAWRPGEAAIPRASPRWRPPLRAPPAFVRPASTGIPTRQRRL